MRFSGVAVLPRARGWVRDSESRKFEPGILGRRDRERLAHMIICLRATNSADGLCGGH